MVNIKDLCIDPEAQRKLTMAWVKQHVPLFDVEQLGYIVVNKRSDGRIYIVDGQHRVELMRMVHWGDQNIHAEIFNGLTQAQEAELFVTRNDRKAVRRYDKFRIQVTARNPAAVDIDRIVKAQGLVISDQSRDKHICAVDVLVQIYLGCRGIASPSAGPTALARALRTLVKSWGPQAASFTGSVMHAMGMVYLRYNGNIIEAELAKKMSTFPGGANGLLGKGKSAKEYSGRPIAHCIATIIVDQYNKGRREHKLETWES